MSAPVSTAQHAARRSPLPLIALIAFFVVEFLLFDQIGAKQHTWVYPRWNDQIQYLTESYTAFEKYRAGTWFDGLKETFVNPAAQGTLHDVGAFLVFSVAGVSRSAALSVNLFWFIAWQALLFVAITRLSGRAAAGWLALALTLVLRTPWENAPGSAYDFRLDWMAACAMGLALAAALRADGFRRPGASLLVGVAVGLTLLTRFLTGTYFAVIYALFLIWTLSGPDRGRRTLWLIASGLVAAAMAAPIFWLNREWVWNYYFIGHFTGPESAIRNPNMGLGQSVAWLFHTLQFDHLGQAFWPLAGSALAVGGAACLVSRKRSKTSPLNQWLVPVSAFFIAPALVLTLHALKSGIVLSALVPPVIVALSLLWGRLPLRPLHAGLIAGLVVIAGLTLYVQQLRRPAHSPEFERDARKVATFADYIFRRSREAGLTNPRVGVDQVTDCLDGQVLRVLCYERKHVWVPFVMTLPTGIMKEKEELLMERITNSDFLFLTEDRPGGGGWPYDEQMRGLLAKHQAWCDEHLRKVETFTLFGWRMSLYERRDLPTPTAL